MPSEGFGLLGPGDTCKQNHNFSELELLTLCRVLPVDLLMPTSRIEDLQHHTW